MFLGFILANFFFSTFCIHSKSYELDLTEEKNNFVFYSSNSTDVISEVKGIADNKKMILDSNQLQLDKLGSQDNFTGDDYNQGSFHGNLFQILIFKSYFMQISWLLFHISMI